MFTPQEVSEKVFPKASFGGGGYSMGAVDEFLDALTEDYTALFKENVTLKTKLKVLAEKVEEYRSTEDAMRQTLLTAQKMAAKLVQEAQTEKEQLLAGARAEAEAEVRRLDDEKKAAQQKLVMAQETLPELELVPAAPAEPAAEPAPQPDKAVEDIEQDILTQFDAAVTEEPKPGTPAIDDAPTVQFPPVNGSAAPGSGFSFDLGDLKFGRNYKGKE